MSASRTACSKGALIAAWAVEAERIYLYMRDEYPAVLHILAHEIAALESAGIIEKGHIELRRGAGAYICGEESAMIESIEGKRGYPRNRPALYRRGRPFRDARPSTTMSRRCIGCQRFLQKGAKWFADHGVNGAKGLRSWSVSGRVKKPGVIVAPAGITARELIELAGGMEDGADFQGLSAGRRVRRHPAGEPRAICRSISERSTNMARSSAATPSWSSPIATTSPPS